ncbi:MAG: radical SAM protein [Candidatus Brocadiaceae bacterium]|nr:radical SAM protein [Candidatus Brocadiaceae bacterium]
MKILLLFPPSWLPSQPFLSLPALTGFLRAQGVEVTQRDINIEFLESVLRRESAQEFLSLIRKELDKGPGRHHVDKYNLLRKATEYLPLVVERIEEARGVFRSEDFYNLEKYIESLNVMDRYLELVGALYYPTTVSTYTNNTRYSVYSSPDLMSALEDEGENLFLESFRRHLLSSILDARPDIVGISITSTSQLLPALTLARLIKGANPDIHLTIGGSIFTKLIDNLLLGADVFFSFVDSFVVFEGEHALLELINQLSGGRDLSKVPNLIYRKNGRVTINEPFYIEDVSKLPTPDYNGLPFGLYHSPKPVLPVQTSRGCYWGKCTFCNLHYDHRYYRPRSIDLIVKDIQTLKERHNTDYFFFADECIPINTLKRLVKVLPGLDIKWIGGVRFEEGLSRELIRDLRHAGCLKLVFGMESYSQRVLNLMKKGIKRETVKRTLEDCLEEGVAAHLYTIIGFPTETAAEAVEGMNFILENQRLVSSPGFSFLPCLYEMEKHSPITLNPRAYGLKRIMSPSRDDLSLGYAYEVKEGLSPQEAEELHEAIMQRVNETVSPFPYNYSMSDGLLYIGRQQQRIENASPPPSPEILF